MYVPFKSITRRKIYKFRDMEGGHEYMMRVYLADGVNIEQRGNTYM
jgi:hypothetical protein